MMHCILCDCSELDACVDEGTRATCAWVEFEPGRTALTDGSGLCTFCGRDIALSPARNQFIDGLRRAYISASGAPMTPEQWEAVFDPAAGVDDAPLVQLATDAECDAMLRSRRAGA